jgi:hypothetical protein
MRKATRLTKGRAIKDHNRIYLHEQYNPIAVNANEIQAIK